MPRTFDSRIYARLRRRTHAVVLGDSHAHAFRDVHVAGVRLDVEVVEGATAHGIANPNSKTEAHAIFQRRIDRAPIWQPLVFMLGEVDCGFVIFYRAQKHRLTLRDQVSETVDNYAAFLAAQDPRRRLIVLSAPLPTILDGQAWGEIANLRREVTATLRQRTDMTLWFNALLLTACREHGWPFVDVTSPLLDPLAQVIRGEYRHPDPVDHHLHPVRYPRLLEQIAGPVLRGDDPVEPRDVPWRPLHLSQN